MDRLRKEKSFELTRILAKTISNAKGSNIRALDVSKVFSLSDSFIIASGRSDRHAQGICNNILARLQEMGIKPLAVEGYDQAHWILIDLGEVIIHIFYEGVRDKYNLESLWVSAEALDLDESLHATNDNKAA